MVGLTSPDGYSCMGLADCASQLKWDEDGNDLLQETWMDDFPIDFLGSHVVGVVNLDLDMIVGKTASEAAAFLCQAQC